MVCHQAAVSRLATKLPAMEVLPVTAPRLEVRMVRTMDNHQAMGVPRATKPLLVTGIFPATKGRLKVEMGRTMDSHRAMGVRQAMEPLLVTVNLLAAELLLAAKVARATGILRAVEVMAALQAMERATEGLLATELIIITPCSHLIHLHQRTRNPVSPRPAQDRLLLSSCRRVPPTQMAPILHPRRAILPQGQGLHLLSQPLGQRTHTIPIPHLAPAARPAQLVTTHQAVPCHLAASFLLAYTLRVVSCHLGLSHLAASFPPAYTLRVVSCHLGLSHPAASLLPGYSHLAASFLPVYSHPAASFHPVCFRQVAYYLLGSFHPALLPQLAFPLRAALIPLVSSHLARIPPQGRTSYPKLPPDHRKRGLPKQILEVLATTILGIIIHDITTIKPGLKQVSRLHPALLPHPAFSLPAALFPLVCSHLAHIPAPGRT